MVKPAIFCVGPNRPISDLEIRRSPASIETPIEFFIGDLSWTSKHVNKSLLLQKSGALLLSSSYTFLHFISEICAVKMIKYSKPFDTGRALTFFKQNA